MRPARACKASYSNMQKLYDESQNSNQKPTKAHLLFRAHLLRLKVAIKAPIRYRAVVISGSICDFQGSIFFGFFWGMYGLGFSAQFFGLFGGVCTV